jgi:hypothetical protein
MGTTLIPPFATANRHRDEATAALAQANRVRLRRAALVRWLHGNSSVESHKKAAELILEPDPTLHSMLVLELLQRVREVGPAQAERMLEIAEVSPTSAVGAPTARQRAGLTALLRLRADQHRARYHHTPVGGRMGVDRIQPQDLVKLRAKDLVVYGELLEVADRVVRFRPLSPAAGWHHATA